MSIPPRTDLEPRLTIRNPLPAQFFHPLSYKFIVLGLLDPYPIPFGFGLQFVTLHYYSFMDFLYEFTN